MERCQEEGCPHAAKNALKICVPALGWARDLHKPMECIFGLKLCPTHAAKYGADNFLGAQLSEEEGNMRQIFWTVARGQFEPDFDRAFIELISLNSKEYIMFESMGAQKQ